MVIRKILFCTDGENHTHKAEIYAVTLAKTSGADLVALYIVNPFMKKFTHEIYAVNRNECRAYLDRSLQKEGENALEVLSQRIEQEGITALTKMRYGYPEEEILKEIKEDRYDMVVMGSKLLKGWKKRFESFKLPESIIRKSPIPVLLVR
jgi:nucleotide-binding universal stress UspA family protein